MREKKIEIIDINLDINIEEEIKKKVDSLSNKVLNETEKICDKFVKLKPKPKLYAIKNDDLEKAINFLIQRAEEWVPSSDILVELNIDKSSISQSKYLNKLSKALNEAITSNNKYVFNKKYLYKTIDGKRKKVVAYKLSLIR